MKHHEIEPGYYMVALRRSGRGGRHIDLREEVRVTVVEPDPFYIDSTQYVVRAERLLANGPRPIKLKPRDVLERCSDERVKEIERVTAACWSAEAHWSAN